MLQTPKSTPAFLPDASSRVGITTARIEPGSIVLRATTTWKSLFSLMAAPISWHTLRTCDRSRLPFSWDGVPTQISEISVFSTASRTSVVARSRPSLTVFEIISPMSFSMIGVVPWLIRSTLVRFGSTPTTVCPSVARQPAETAPT